MCARRACTHTKNKVTRNERWRDSVMQFLVSFFNERKQEKTHLEWQDVHVGSAVAGFQSKSGSVCDTETQTMKNLAMVDQHIGLYLISLSKSLER